LTGLIAPGDAEIVPIKKEIPHIDKEESVEWEEHRQIEGDSIVKILEPEEEMKSEKQTLSLLIEGITDLGLDQPEQKIDEAQ